MMRFAAATVLALSAPAFAQEDTALTAPGAWQGNYTLTRIDPRIRTRGGAEMIQMQVIQDRGARMATVSWNARRGICLDPLDGPCEWIGANGTDTARIVGNTLVLALRLSPDDSDPAILVLQRQPAAAKKPARFGGFIANARADWDMRFDAARGGT